MGGESVPWGNHGPFSKQVVGVAPSDLRLSPEPGLESREKGVGAGDVRGREVERARREDAWRRLSASAARAAQEVGAGPAGDAQGDADHPAPVVGELARLGRTLLEPVGALYAWATAHRVRPLKPVSSRQPA